MRHQTNLVRDAALDKLARITRWVIAISVALTAVLSEVAASAFPGKTIHPASHSGVKRTGTHSSHSTTSSSSSSRPTPLSPPAHAPQTGSEQATPTTRESPSSSGASSGAFGLAAKPLRKNPPPKNPPPPRNPPPRMNPRPRGKPLRPGNRNRAHRVNRRRARSHLPRSSREVPDVNASSPASGALTCASWEALGTNISMRLTDADALAPARANVERELAAIDLACSRFRDDSDLSRLNARAGRAVRTSPLLIEALELALRARPADRRRRRPDGRPRARARGIRPGLASAEQAARHPGRTSTAGWCAGWRAERRRACEATARGPGPSAALVAEHHDRSRLRARVRVPPSTKLDLGATAKAWAADRAAQAAAQVARCGVLVSVGGDIATAGGCPPGGWQVRVTDDHRSDVSAPGQTISIALRRPGDLQHDGQALESARRDDAPHHRPRDRASRGSDLAHGERRGGELRRRERRRDGRARARAERARLAGRAGLARAAGRRRRSGALRRGLADRGRHRGALVSARGRDRRAKRLLVSDALDR